MTNDVFFFHLEIQAEIERVSPSEGIKELDIVKENPSSGKLWRYPSKSSATLNKEIIFQSILRLD